MQHPGDPRRPSRSGAPPFGIRPSPGRSLGQLYCHRKFDSREELMKVNRLAVLIVVSCLLTSPGFAAQEGGFDRTLKVNGPVDLDVSTGSGGITINRGGSGQVVIHATIRASEGWFSGDVSDRIRAIEQNPPIEQNGNVVRIGHFTDSERSRNISISYDIQVPADVRVHSRTG